MAETAGVQQLRASRHVPTAMSRVFAVLIATFLLTLSACENLPPAQIPYQPNAQQGGGDAYFNHYRNVGQ